MRRGVFCIGCLAMLLSLIAPTVQGAALLPVGTFEVLPGESSVTFTVPDNRGGFTGSTTRVTGRIVIQPPLAGDEYVVHVKATIDAASITTGNGMRDNTMRSAFLHTAEFPAMIFEGTVDAHPALAVRPFAATVHGQLTIRGETRPVEFPATVTALADEYVADGVATVRMADYHIPYPRAFIFVARDPVTVKVHVRARPAPLSGVKRLPVPRGR